MPGTRASFDAGGFIISGDIGMPTPRAGDPPEGEPLSGRASFGQVFALGEFRALWLAQILSVGGDQLARVALTLLVFDRTHSALLAAVTFAASVAPTFLGSILLSGLADRLPRREVMVACDLIRAALVAVMALPGMPVAVLVCLLFLVTLISAPFTSARAALYPDILTGDLYVFGTAVTLTTIQFAQVVGFAAGGAVVGFFGVRTSLVVDAATFVGSALVIRIWVRARPAPQPHEASASVKVTGILAGTKLVFADPRLRVPMLYGWLVAFLDLHEGIAAPLAASLGGGAVAVGLILAAGAFGTSVGAVAFSRFMDPVRRLKAMGPLAVASCAVLMLFALRPGLSWAIAILAFSGILSCYQLAANAAFVRAAPQEVRSQAFGVAQAGMSLGQGAAMVLAGALVLHFAPTTVVAAGGALGTVTAGMIALNRQR
jgi:MFS family permease